MIDIKKFIGPIIFTLVSLAYLFLLLAQSPRVLVLHSYSPSYSWTKIVDSFLKEGFQNRKYLRHRYYYMNSKRYFTDKAEKVVLRTIQEESPDVIVAFDDNAQQLISNNFELLPPDTNIVFAGVNGYVKKYNYEDKENITGIYERKPISGILFVLRSFNKINNTEHFKNIVYLGDSSTSSEIDLSIFNQDNWQDFNFSGYLVSTLDEWKSYISTIDTDKTNYLLVSGYRKLITGYKSDGTPTYADYQDVVEWTQKNSPVKVLALNVFGAIDGFAFAIGSSPAEQANEALNLVDEILLNKVKPSDLPYKYPTRYSIALNESALKEKNYKVPTFILSFAEAANNIF